MLRFFPRLTHRALASRKVPFAFASTLLLAFMAFPALAEEPLRALLLDYNAPIEHDVLQSFLCVDPCQPSTGCLKESVSRGVDFRNDSLELFRPRYLGQSARFVVGAYKDESIDLLSISGHHASGFSGDFGRGSFYTTKLAGQLDGLPGRDAFFASPSVVMLQGCWTDVKSGFVGDPIEYVRHIVEDTTVRAGESERLLAAIQQIAGEDEAYRELFPNACILGYQGTQIPGGLAEIFGQTSAFMRGVAESVTGVRPPAKYSFAEARRSKETLNTLVREIDRECGPTGWPCNLCRRDPAHYEPLRDSLIAALRAERQRLRRGEARTAPGASRLEALLEDSSLYSNVRWSCSTQPTTTLPIYPRPIDRGPHLELFVDLLMVNLGSIAGEQRKRIESELVHLLGATEVDAATRERLRLRQLTEQGLAWRRDFTERTLLQLSAFRQRDFFDFLSQIGCATCFEEVLGTDAAQPLRENAASQLRPRLGAELYRRGLEDDSARVRLLTASRLIPTLGQDLYALAAGDTDERVRQAAQKTLELAPQAPSPVEVEEDLDANEPLGATNNP